MRRGAAARGRIIPPLFSVVFALALLALALAASVAPAATKTERPLLFSFDTGLQTGNSIAVDDATGAVYVTEYEGPSQTTDLGSHPIFLKKFHADGTPWNFTATGGNVVPLYSVRATVAVDNSGGATQGDIYVAEPGNEKVLSSETNQLVAYNPDGTVRWRISPSYSFQIGQLAVDASGHLWTFGGGPTGVHEYDPSTNPPTEIGSVGVSEANLGGELDSAGALYAIRFEGPGFALQKWVNGSFVSTFTEGSSFKNRIKDVSIDQSSASGHIFVAHWDVIDEFEPNGTKLEAFAANYLGGSEAEFGPREEARSIAYNATLDRLYVLVGKAESGPTAGGKPRVLVFGTQESGTEAAVTANAPSAVGVSSAHLSGTVNPENTSVEWHFEWKTPVQSWAVAGSSPAQALPNDALDHEVELDTNALHGGTTYQVRLVAVDTATRLASFSNVVSLTTTAASAAPAVTIDSPSNITTSSAKVSGTVDPEGDTADWKVQLSKGAGCAGPFVDQTIGQIEEGTSSPVPVEATLTGLLPGESYCARIVATNSAVGNETEQLTVDASGGTFMLDFKGESTAWSGEGKLEPESTTITEVSASSGVPTPGETISGIGIKPNTKVESYNAGAKTITLSQPTAASVLSHKVSLTAVFAFDASAEAVQNALNALPTIGGAGGSVAVTGGPGDAGGTHPYEITFRGRLGKLDVPQLVADDIDLSGGAESATVSTTTPGAPEAISESKEFETLEVQPTQVFAAFVAPRTDTTARLNGYVNPEGAKVTYHFEYSSDGGASWTPLPDGEDTSKARTQIVVSSELTGLQPQTEYSYRVTVENTAGGETSQPLSFTTRSTAEVTLPTRGVELVNSPDKGTQNVTPPFSAMQESPISEDGEKVLWRVLAGAPGGNNSSLALFLAKRTPGGWVSRSVQPPASEQVKGGELSYYLDAITPDLSHFVMAVERPEVFSTPAYSAVVRLDDAENQAVLAEVTGTTSFGHVDLTEDAAHVLVIAGGYGQLVDVGSGSPEVVSIMPDGMESECLLRNGESFTGGQVGGGSKGPANVWRAGYHLINTQDASIVYFEASPNGDCNAKQRLYVRDRNAGVTTLIDPGTSKGEPEFMRTTPDGRYGYFATYSQLDPADTNQGRDIYRWDEESGESRCLTCVVADAKVGQSIISDDFSRIYFQSQQQLVAGKGIEGGENIYLLHEGVLSFVATPELAGQQLRESTLSADGADLLFVAKASRSLTSDAVGTPTGCHLKYRGEEELHGPTGTCTELYRYEAEQHSIECISCARGTTTTYRAGSPGPGEANDFRMSADGSTVAFATREALVRADVNRNTDIYEWHNGSIRLVTDGVTAFQENVAAPQVNAVDRDGKNIFFSVVEPGLTGYEQDEFLNLYDARVGGGFPRPTPVVHCSEESCQGPLQAPPLQGAAGSASLSGAGNEKAQPKARCRKGQARRHGRCVKRDRHAHHKRASHGKRGGSK